MVLSTPICSQNLERAPSNIDIFFSLPRDTGLVVGLGFELVLDDFYVIEF
jgi:hypothetical protein